MKPQATKLATLTAVITTFLLTTGIAKANDYFGVNYMLVEVESADPDAVQFKYGTMVDKNLAIEGRLGLGISDDNSVELDNFFGVYAAYNFMPTEKFNPYAVLGFTRGKISAGSNSESGSDLSFGIGLNVNHVVDSVTLNIEWINLYNDDGIDVDSVNLGAIWRL